VVSSSLKKSSGGLAGAGGGGVGEGGSKALEMGMTRRS
jgi:hypothetical protein